MPLPQKITKHYELSRTDKAIAEFCWLEKPTPKNFNIIGVIAQVEAGIEAFRAKATTMSNRELLTEPHKSTRLAEQLTLSGDPRPHSLADAHAIVSGGHDGAWKARVVLAWYRIRIDDYVNGCWLPRNTDARNRMPNWLKRAVPHSRIHRFGYYMWLNREINETDFPYDPEKRAINEKKLKIKLSWLEFELQTSTFPSYVMKPKGMK